MEKDFLKELEEKKASLKTVEDYKAAYSWLSEEVLSMYAASVCLEDAVSRLHGEKGLDEVIELAMTYVENAPIEENEIEQKAKKQFEEMNSFGYKKENMVPITFDFAKRLVSSGHRVFELHSDNTETLITSESQITENAKYGVSGSEIDAIMESIFETERG